MLFSRDDVAQFVNENFEAAWESVRPVPTVRIDFGNGTVITRTLHGNIATYVCTGAGQVVDILPGIYEPNTYLSRLNQLRLLGNYARLRGAASEEFVREYHRRGAAVSKTSETGPRKEVPPKAAPPVVRGDMTKRLGVENPIETIVAAGTRPVSSSSRPDTASAGAKPASPADLATWKLLLEDTRHNETVRRRQIHEMLAGTGLVRPEALTKRLYKDILHADLEDPYLGLGDVLFASYPFRGEEKPR